MELRIVTAGTDLAALVAFAAPANAMISCHRCIAAYQACVASGAGDCVTRDATCLRDCPTACLAHALQVPPMSMARPEPLPRTADSQDPAHA